MASTILEERIIPAAHGMAFNVQAGQIMRVIEIEGVQCADIAIFNAHDYKEVYDAWRSYLINSRRGTGDTKTLRYLYSKAPRLNVMFEVIEDKVRSNWCLSGTSCILQTYQDRGIKGYHRNCYDNLAEAIAPFGLSSDDVPDVFNVFMNVEYSAEGYPIDYKPVPAKKGDYIDLLAKMDCLVAISACPSNRGGGAVPRPVKVEIRVADN